MNKLPRVSVGIAAYNEEKNIGNVLQGVLSQRQEGWKLEEVLVYGDGCTDQTAQKAREFKNKRIKLIDGRKRKGKVARVNQMCRRFKGDILIIFDADLRFGDKEVISRLVKPFKRDPKAMLVGGNTRPFSPKTFFEKAVYATFLVFDESRKKMKAGHNIFGCNGGCLGVRSELARRLRLPNVVNEDDYLYFSCLSQGFKFRHVRRAVVFYRLPGNLKDYLKQVFRSNPEAVTLNLSKHFGKLVKEEYHRPLLFYLKSVLKAGLENPLGVVFIAVVNLLTKPFFPLISGRYKLDWYVAGSTK